MALEKIMTEPEYREVSAISYSMLSGVSKTPASLLNKMKLDTPSLTYGSAVDTLCFDGEKVFNEKFIINSGNSPSKQVELIVKDIMSNIVNANGSLIGTLDDYDDLILSIAQAQQYGKGWKDETIIRKIKDEGGREVFQFSIESFGKKVLDTIQYNNVLNSRQTLFTHPFSKEWFNVNNDEQILFQFPILWKYKGKPCKSLFDIIKINHKDKIIYPVDLKTSYDHVLGFPYNYIKWCYPLQSSFYSEGLKYWKLENPQFIDYRIDYFRFCIISSQDPFKPLVYKTTDDDLWAGKHGGFIKRNGNHFKGFDQLIDDMEWHLENMLYDYPREVYEKQGELALNVF